MRALEAVPGLGTYWWIELFDEKTPDEATLRAFVEERMRAFEATYSRFRDDSLLSRLNAEGEVVSPPEEFVALLAMGVDFYTATEGVFNMLVGEEMLRRGYDSSYSLRATQAMPVTSPDPTKELTISPEKITLKEGMVDIGGFGKGYFVDRLTADLMRSFGIRELLVNGGGDLYVTSERDAPIEIHLEDPIREGYSIGSIDLKERGFAASASNRRRWTTLSGETSHLVDTREPTAAPSDRATYVIAQSAVEADVWATTLALAPHTQPPADIWWAQYDPATTHLSASPGFSSVMRSQG